MKLKTTIVFVIAVVLAIAMSGAIYIGYRRYPSVHNQGYSERKIPLKTIPAPSSDANGITEMLRNYIRRNDPYIAFFPATGDNNLNPAMIVVPGGAYSGRAEMEEGVTTAKWLNSIGISAFVLHYRVAPYRYPAALYDLQEAIRHVRKNAAQLHINPNKTGVLGFSAGGHLTATLTTLNKDATLRPDVLVLCYPVLTMNNKYTHQRTKRNLLGDAPSESTVSLLSAEKNVHSGMPPVFVWTTLADKHVSVQNCELFVEALKLADVPYEYHLFNDGWHGMGLAEGVKEAGNWPVMLHCWLECMGFVPQEGNN